MKSIVVGIDVSKEKLDASAIDVRNHQLGVVLLEYRTFDNNFKGFQKMQDWVENLIEGIELNQIMFCCETTGGYDRALCDYLYAAGIDIWREGALQIKRSMGVRKGKDDKADSLMIAEYAMRNMDKADYYVTPDQNVRALKSLFLYRNTLVKERTEKKVRAKQLEETMPMDDSLKFILKDAAKTVERLDESIKKCEKQIEKVLKQDDDIHRNYKHIISIKGVGLINAVALIAYSNNFKAIKTSRKMASYYGICIFRETSGTSVNKKAYTKYYSSSLLRATLTQAAECTIMKNGIYRAYYDRLKAKGKPTGVVLNNIKNKLMHLMFSLVKNDTDYVPGYEHQQGWKANQKCSVNFV